MIFAKNRNPKLSEERYWYAFYTKSRHEFKADMDFNSIGVEHYLPTVTTIKQWSDRKKKVTEPLFRGYIFAKVNEYERAQVLMSEAIVNTVSFSGQPAHVREFQIENLKKALSKNPEVFVTNRIEVGTRVVIRSGSFEGIEGVVYSDNSDGAMIAITCDMLQRSVVVRLPAAVIKKKVY